MHGKHAQFNWKSAIFGLQIGSFQGRSFPTAGQRNEDAGYEGVQWSKFCGLERSSQVSPQQLELHHKARAS